MNISRYLLPHRLRKPGIWLMVGGLSLWLFMQMGQLSRLAGILIGAQKYYSESSPLWWLNVVSAVAGISAFLIGLCLVTLTCEPVEDERVHQVRTESFFFAARVQMLSTLLIAAFLVTSELSGTADDAATLGLFCGLLVIFWASYLIRFRYQLAASTNPACDE